MLLPLPEELAPYRAIIDRFLAGTLPDMNHARHVAVANIVARMAHGRELVHLGLQATAIRNGVPEKYDRAMTDRELDKLDGKLPPLDAFADVL